MAALTEGGIHCVSSVSSNTNATQANASSGGTLAWLNNNQLRLKMRLSIHNNDIIYHLLNNYYVSGAMLSSLQTVSFFLSFFFLNPRCSLEAGITFYTQRISSVSRVTHQISQSQQPNQGILTVSSSATCT